MTDHKFEPFEKVLVRNTTDEKWKADFYSHHRTENWPHECAGDVYKMCIPYTPENAHLLGTSQPYEPPKPPVEYEWGQKVEVMISGEWEPALYLKYNGHEKRRPHNIVRVKSGPDWVESDQIRPLPDTASHLDAKP